MLTKKTIAEESLKLFQSYGFRVSMDELAKVLHISKKTLYEQVSTKSELFILVINYYDNYLDEKNEEFNKTNSSEIDQFMNALYYYATIAFVPNDVLNQMKAYQSDVYECYNRVINNRWKKTFDIIDKFFEKNQKILINKDIFKFLFLSSLEGLYVNKKNNNLIEIDEIVKELINLLMNGVSPSLSNINNFVKFLSLLYDSTIALAVVDVNGKAETLYMSSNFNSLFNLNGYQSIDDIYNKIKIHRLDELKDLIFTSTKNHNNIDIEYQFESQNKLRKHHFKATPIDVEKRTNPYLILIIDETEIIEKNQVIQNQETHLQLAFSQTNIGIWEYNIKNDEFKISKKVQEEFNLNIDVIKDFSKNVNNRFYIDDKSYDAFLKFFNNIISGIESDSCVLLLKDNLKKNKWVKVSYKTIFNEDNTPKLAIGIAERVNYLNDVKSRYEQEDILPKILNKELLLTFKYNVSKNTIIDISKHAMFKYILEDKNYNNFIDQLVAKFPNEEDKLKFIDLFNYNNILTSIENGLSSSHMNFRFLNNEGNIVWYSFTMNFVLEPISSDYYVFSYVRDINSKMQLELMCDRKVEYDVTTRLYIGSTYQKLVNILITKHNNANSICAMSLIEISNFTDIKRQYGLDVAQKILFLIGRIFRIYFNNKNIVGRVSDNQFSVFFPDVLSIDSSIKELEEALSLAQDSYILSTNEKRIAKLNTTIYFSRINSVYYNRLIYECKNMLDGINKETNTEIIANTNINNNISLEYSNKPDYANVVDSELLEQLKVVSTEASYKDSINKMLVYINDYYQAYRSSLFVLKNNVLVLKYGYSADNDFTINDFKVDLNMLPGLNLICKKKRTIAINNVELIKSISVQDYNFLKNYNINSIYIKPLVEKGEVIGFLTVSNLTFNLDKLGILEAVSYKISSDLVKEKLEKEKKFTRENDSLTEIYNHATYVKHVAEIKEAHQNSLGVATLKCRGLRQMNIELGRDYGDSMIKFVSKILKSNFRKEDLFRTDNNRFDIICIDIDYQLFVNRIKKSINEINEVYNNLVLIGYTWSDNDIDVEKMINHSEEIMLASEISQEDKEFLYEELDIDSLIENNCFEVYLQPKFYLSNLQIDSAEALIRLNHPKLGMVSPMKFIPLLEKKGVVSIIDLFVLETVCKLISKWKNENRKLITIAVNYSRKTIIKEDIVKDTIQILDKYNVSPSSIEIEITETIGDMEQKKIAEISNKFMSKGIKLSIDDFGSRYSSLSTLSIIPFSSVKLDKSIVNDLVVNARSQVIVEYIIMMCKKLNMKSIAEGIENEEQLNALKQKGCMVGQGYYFEKPIPIKEFEEKYNKVE